jgi:hypothetical protein
MRRWRVIYGGQRYVEAETEADAYRAFWAWLQEQIASEQVGLVFPEEEGAEAQERPR